MSVNALGFVNSAQTYKKLTIRVFFVNFVFFVYFVLKLFFRIGI